MDIYVASEIGSCTEYLPKQKEPMSIVISPVRIEGTEGKLKVVSGCNMWQGCQNKNCYFSSAARKEPKIKAKI